CDPALPPFGMTAPTTRLWALAFALLWTTFAAARAEAVTAVCGMDALQNTQTVLCGNGTCSASEVHLTTPVEVTAGGCLFDLSGRDLFIEKPFRMAGSGFIKVINAKN